MDKEKARMELCRKIGAAFANALATTHSSFEEIDSRLELPDGFTNNALFTLMSGHPVSLDVISDMASAMDAEFSIWCDKRRDA
jgi:hypothetical protein